MTPEIVTDQTPAHDVSAYVPHHLSVEEADRLRADDPDAYERESMASMAEHVRAMLAFQERGRGSGRRRRRREPDWDDDSDPRYR